MEWVILCLSSVDYVLGLRRILQQVISNLRLASLESCIVYRASDSRFKMSRSIEVEEFREADIQQGLGLNLERSRV